MDNKTKLFTDAGEVLREPKEVTRGFMTSEAIAERAQNSEESVMEVLSNYRGEIFNNKLREIVNKYGMEEYPNHRGTTRLYRVELEKLVETKDGHARIKEGFKELIKILYNHSSHVNVIATNKRYYDEKDGKCGLIIPITDMFEVTEEDENEYDAMRNVSKLVTMIVEASKDVTLTVQINKLIHKGYCLVPKDIEELNKLITYNKDEVIEHDFLVQVVEGFSKFIDKSSILISIAQYIKSIGAHRIINDYVTTFQYTRVDPDKDKEECMRELSRRMLEFNL